MTNNATMKSLRPKLVVLQEFLSRYPVLEIVNRIPDEPPADDPRLKEGVCAMHFHYKTYTALRESNIRDYTKWNCFRNWATAARLLLERHIQLDHTAGPPLPEEIQNVIKSIALPQYTEPDARPSILPCKRPHASVAEDDDSDMDNNAAEVQLSDDPERDGFSRRTHLMASISQDSGDCDRCIQKKLKCDKQPPGAGRGKRGLRRACIECALANQKCSYVHETVTSPKVEPSTIAPIKKRPRGRPPKQKVIATAPTSQLPSSEGLTKRSLRTRRPFVQTEHRYLDLVRQSVGDLDDLGQRVEHIIGGFDFYPFNINADIAPIADVLKAISEMMVLKWGVEERLVRTYTILQSREALMDVDS